MTVKDISKGCCETRIYKIFKAFGKVSGNACGFKLQYSFILRILFVLCSINISHVFILTQRDGKTTQINCAILAISVSKMQAVVNVE